MNLTVYLVVTSGFSSFDYGGGKSLTILDGSRILESIVMKWGTGALWHRSLWKNFC